ncbi:MAG: lysylphosphatidylglycerol synthase transmembrane domain-containing protein [Anaerolineaceae bacterium]|nr:lysylphosphatidylglycerol synthase transmembrane domain-containing protein [Anaerolineaceae bacterium]
MGITSNESLTPSGSVLRRLIPGLLFGFFVLLALALFGDLRQVGQTILRFNWWIFPLALLFTLFNYTLRFFKWHYYLGQIGVRGISKKESLRLFVAGFPLAVTPGKVGEALKGIWLKQISGLPVGRGISVVVAERISDGLAVLGLSTIGVIAYPRYWPAFLIVLILLLSVIILSQIRPAALWVLSFGERIPLVKRFVTGLREFYEGSFTLFRPLPTLFAVGLGIISWLGEGIGFYFILKGLGLADIPKLLVTAVFVLSFSTVVGAVSALPGGLGAAEVSIAGMLTLLMQIEPSIATTATLLIRLATLWFGVLLGLFVWLISPNLIGLRTHHESVVES